MCLCVLPFRLQFPWGMSPIFDAPNETRLTPQRRVGIRQKSHRYSHKGEPVAKCIACIGAYLRLGILARFLFIAHNAVRCSELRQTTLTRPQF